MTNAICNPLGLSQQEMPMYELFKKTEKREPSCMLELMNYSAGLQQINANERRVWCGIFGL